ncbi:MAG: nitroreductase family protein, partial [Clostridia bacterium]|nr:nitroreductase family protein [Clostridia bacterium]
MDFIELAKSRYSVRSFSQKKVEDDKLKIILEAAKVAPTACNNQPQKLYVLQSGKAIKKLNAATKFVFGASTAIIFTSDKTDEWKNPFTSDYHTGEIDCSIVCTHVMMQAWELGIGSCWIGYFDPEKVRKAFSIPKNEQIVAILPLGYPAEGCKPAAGHTSFRPMDEMVK